MELSHIKLKNSNTERIDATIYANTIISTESVAHTTTPKSGDSGQNEGFYEKLRLGTKQNEAKRTQNASRSLHWEDIPNRIKYAVYAIIAVIVVLFVAVIVLIVLIALPKNTVHGSWSQWSPWGSCTVSCGIGMEWRDRTCSRHYPSRNGNQCYGESRDYRICMPGTCADRKVAFTVYGTNSTNETSNVAIKFPNTHLNTGGGYSTSTGRFTCKIPGIYHFAVTLTKRRQNIDLIDAYLRVNGSSKLRLYSDPDDTHDDHVDFGSYSLSVAGNFHLNKNDYVYVDSVPSHFFSNDTTSFTGVLVIPDE